MEKKITRKEFLQQLAALGLLSVGAGTVLTSCGKKEEKPAAETETPPAAETTPNEGEAMNDPCTDVSGLTEAELKMRQSLQYVGESPYPEKLCDNCQFWVAPAEGETCGTCKIVKGPINPKGHCTSWAAKQG